MVKTENISAAIKRKATALRRHAPPVIFFLYCGVLSAGFFSCATAFASERYQPQTVFVYGEIVAVDGVWNSITIRHFDYGALKEDDIQIKLKKSTTWENVTGIRGLNVGDWAGVTYLIWHNGGRVAESVNVDKPPPKEL